MTNSQIDVLLVEDNPADAELVLESLRDDGRDIVVHVAHDGADALDLLFAREAYADRRTFQPPRLVLLDIKLPRVDGFGVLRELKTHPVLRVIPVVMLTSSLVSRDVAECYRLGANSYVQKPVDFVRFRDTIQGIARYWLDVNAWQSLSPGVKT